MTESFRDRLRATMPDRFAAPPASGPVPAIVGNSSDTTYGLAALQSECRTVASAIEGTRNATLNTAAFRMGRLIAAGQLSADTARDALTSAGLACGLARAEVDLLLRERPDGGLQAGTAHPRTVADRDPLPDIGEFDPGEQADADVVAAWVHEHLPAIDWHVLWADDEPEEWILEPLLPARRLVALYSAPKVGKSLLMLEMAVAIARGSDALGVKPDRPRRVLYVDFENDPKADIRERLQDMGHAPGDLAGLRYLSFPALAALDSARGGRMLLAAARVHDCEVVVIDTVSRSVNGDENENDTWLAFYRHTGMLLKKAGIALVRLDHSGKDEAKGQRGGSAKSGDVDAVWRMSRVTDDTYRLDCEAARMPVTERTLVLHRESGPLRHRVDAAGRVAVWRTKVGAIVAAMDAAGLPADAGSTKAREAARAAGIRARNDLVADAIRVRKSRLESVPELGDRWVEQDRSPSDGDRWGPMDAR